MKMKRYFASDSRQALKELREDQGPDAVILSNKRVDGGVEIIAALDYEDSLENSSLGKPNILQEHDDDIATASRATAAAYDLTRQASRTNVDADLLESITSEIKGLRNIMEAPMMQMSWGEMSKVQPLQAKLLKQFMTLGLSTKLCKALTSKVVEQGSDKTAWIDALKLLAAVIPVTDTDIMETGGVISLLGPTGVGKTTTIAKLAARFALRHGRRQVSLITTDSYRIAAHEQLRTYGRILGVPVQVAIDAPELRAALKNIPTDNDAPHLTLIDTAGISQSDARMSEHLATLRNTGREISNYLVMSATSQLSQQEQVVKAFRKADLKGCILTKTDEATSLGEAISNLVELKLPLAYICDGQKVPDDLQRARGKVLVKLAVSLMKKSTQPPSAEELAFSFGGVSGGVINV